ncbi:MAG: S8 family peptidase [Longimicrobiaceae bacterium]
MTRRSIVLLSILALAACSDQARSPVAPATPTEAARSAAGRYIVVFKDASFGGPRASVSRAITEAAEGQSIEPSYVYSAALKGFAAELSERQLAALRADPRVAYVEPDAEVKLFTTQTVNLFSWGLDRIDDVDLPVDASYTYTADGTGVTAYVLDSGINPAHLDFGTRAGFIPNGNNGDFVNDGHGSAQDCHGHGTHVSGTIGGIFSGVAKNVTIRVGRVVNCSGGGTASMVIAGMDWVAANGTHPAVVNMSLGYGNVTSVKNAAENLVAAGFVVAVAAGNGNFAGQPIDACTESPANAPNVLTVGATDNTDKEASFSNYGTCVDILAPGVAIYSSDYSVTNQVVSMSGTSMASPHVAGVAALYLQNNPTATPAQVAAAVKGIAKSNTITLHQKSKKNGTPNLFLFTNY